MINCRFRILFTSQVIDYQISAIGKAIRPLLQSGSHIYMCKCMHRNLFETTILLISKNAEWNSIKLQQIPCAITEFHVNIVPFEIYAMCLLYTIKLMLASYCAVYLLDYNYCCGKIFGLMVILMRNSEISWQPF